MFFNKNLSLGLMCSGRRSEATRDPYCLTATAPQWNEILYEEVLLFLCLCDFKLYLFLVWKNVVWMFHQKLIRMLLRILFSTHCVRHARDRLRCLFKTPSIVLLVLLGIAFIYVDGFCFIRYFLLYFLLVPVSFVSLLAFWLLQLLRPEKPPGQN